MDYNRYLEVDFSMSCPSKIGQVTYGNLVAEVPIREPILHTNEKPTFCRNLDFFDYDL